VPDYAAIPAGASLLWNMVAGTPVRLDAWLIGLQLDQLPAGYTRNTPLVPGSAAAGTAAAPTANPDYIQHIEGPFASFVHPGLVNAHFVSFVQNQSATTVQEAILIENATSVYDTPADAAQDYALRMQRVQCCVPPVSVGAIGDRRGGGRVPRHPQHRREAHYLRRDLPSGQRHGRRHRHLYRHGGLLRPGGATGPDQPRPDHRSGEHLVIVAR